VIVMVRVSVVLVLKFLKQNLVPTWKHPTTRCDRGVGGEALTCSWSVYCKWEIIKSVDSRGLVDWLSRLTLKSIFAP
jgi:hypothetical protein